MSFGEELVGQALDAAGMPVRAIRRVIACVLIGMFVAFPTTARHGLMKWADHQAKHWTSTLIGSLPKPAPSPGRVPTSQPPRPTSP